MDGNMLAQVEFTQTDGLTPNDIKYFAQPYWDEKTAAAKLAVLWDMLVPTDADGNKVITGPQDFRFKDFPEMMEANHNNTFCIFSDEIRHARSKVVHGQGLHAKVVWKALTAEEGNPYTGMYATGSENVIMRLSETQNIAYQGLLPSVAFKFLRDGLKSKDIVAMPSFEPTSSWNFWENAMKTRVEPITEESNKCLFNTLISAL